MTHVQFLRPSPRFLRLHAALPVLPVVRGQGHPTDWQDADTAIRQQPAQAGNAGRVDGLGTQRDGFASAGEGKSTRTRSDWLGSEYGIRALHPSETALSWSEILVFLKTGAMNV